MVEYRRYVKTSRFRNIGWSDFSIFFWWNDVLFDFLEIFPDLFGEIGESLDWFKGKSTGNHGFYHQIWGFPVNFPIIQFYEWNDVFFVGEMTGETNQSKHRTRSRPSSKTPMRHADMPATAPPGRPPPWFHGDFMGISWEYRKIFILVLSNAT